MGSSLCASEQDGILLLRFENADGYPRLELRIVAELERQLRSLSESVHLRGAVLTGTDRCFAAGAEISEVHQLNPISALEFAARGQGLARQIAQSKKPIVAAIQGFCMGGGLDLALACRERLAAPNAVFGSPGGSIGIVTDWGGTQRLPRLIGRGRAREMLIVGTRLNAQEAFECGLIRRIVPADKLMAAAIESARHAV